MFVAAADSETSHQVSVGTLQHNGGSSLHFSSGYVLLWCLSFFGKERGGGGERIAGLHSSSEIRHNSNSKGNMNQYVVVGVDYVEGGRR